MNGMKALMRLIGAMALFGVTAAFAGTLEPPGPPGPSMRSLQQIWDELQEVKSELNAKTAAVQTGQDDVSALVLNFARAQGAVVSNLWQTQVVDAAGAVGRDNALAFTPAGHPAVSYRDVANNDLKYAAYDGSAWRVETVDAACDVRDATSLAFTPSGQPAIAYYDQAAYDLRYAEFDGSAWTLQIVDSVDIVGQFASLAFTPAGRPAISYYDAGNADLKYAEWNGSVWVKTVVDGASSTVGFYTSLAFTPAGRPAISYFGGNPNNDLKYAEYDGSAWTVQTVDSEGNTGYYTSLAFTPDGQPAISYYDSSSVRLLYARRDGAAWVRSVVRTGTSIGFCTSLAFTPGGHPALATTDYPNRDVIYAEFDGAQWQSLTVDAAGEVGLYVSLAFGPEGWPAIAYFDDTNDDLKFATIAGQTVLPTPTAVRTGIEAVASDVVRVSAQAAAVSNQVATVTSNIAALGSQGAGVSNQVATVTSELAALRSQTAGVSNQVVDVRGLLSGIDSRLAALSNLLDSTDQRVRTIEQRLQAAGLPVVSGDRVLIPAGPFQMGDANDAETNAFPLHVVQTGAFYVDRYEVSLALWAEVRAWGLTNGYTDLPAGTAKAPNHPVVDVDWFDCVKWCNARSERDGLTPAYQYLAGSPPVQFWAVYRHGEEALVDEGVRWSSNGYRLPTEAEWERAARGGVVNRRFPWPDANTIQHARANYFSLSNYWMIAYDTNPTSGFHPDYNVGSEPFTSPVGSFAANGYGLFDMAGNVREWCWDWYDNVYYASSPSSNPRGPSSGSHRVERGGCWYDYANYCRAADRSSSTPSGSNNGLGFRPVRAAP
jgi:formylglycine-generating enzyme required for sulfatase activity